MPEFLIHAVTVGAGELAISPIPGRTRHYGTDRERLLEWAPDVVISMTTQAELDRKGAGGLGSDLEARGIVWRHLPVEDFGAPESQVLQQWPDVSKQARSVLRDGGKVLVHCYGGCGRSGMAALRLMVEMGEEAAVALQRLRAVRACAVETDAQMVWAMGG